MKFTFMRFLIMATIIIWAITLVLPSMADASDRYFLGFINDDNRAYLEIPMDKNTRLKKKGIDPGKKIIAVEKKELEIQITLPKNKTFKIYSMRGYEGIFKIKGYAYVQNLGTGALYPYVELDKEISGIAPIDSKIIQSNPLVAVIQDEKGGEPIKNKQYIIKKPADYKHAEILNVLHEERDNITDKWELNVFEGVVDTSGKNKLVVDASNKDNVNSWSKIVIIDMGKKDKRILTIRQFADTGDKPLFMRVAFGSDFDGDGFAEFVVCKFTYDGYFTVIYKWELNQYKEINTSYYFGG